MIAPEIRAYIGLLLDKLAGLGCRVVASEYSPECFGNWVVDLTGPTAFRMCRDRSQFMVTADRQSIERADLCRAFDDREEFASLVLAWAAGPRSRCR
ncbi:MAG: hypothetical protein ACKVX7_06240 [Planctomycetota bacterium]